MHFKQYRTTPCILHSIFFRNYGNKETVKSNFNILQRKIVIVTIPVILQARAEKEIRDLGVVKEKLEAEWELVKFMGQEENTELREKMEDLEETITQEQERKKGAEEKLELQNKLLIGIRCSSSLLRLNRNCFKITLYSNKFRLLQVTRATVQSALVGRVFAWRFFINTAGSENKTTFTFQGGT